MMGIQGRWIEQVVLLPAGQWIPTIEMQMRLCGSFRTITRPQRRPQQAIAPILTNQMDAQAAPAGFWWICGV